jgi:glucokinase
MTIGHPYLAIDLGGSHTRLGLFASPGTPQFTLLTSFPTKATYEGMLDFIETALKVYEVGPLEGAGVSVGGRVAKDGRSLVFGPNLPDYLQKPFAQDLERLLHCPVRLAHDTVCGLLGEKLFGVLHDIERGAYLTLSTGTGAAIQLSKGETVLTSSMEIGHQILDGNERVCLCGQVGCLETFTGGRQLELRYKRPVSEFAEDASFWQVFVDKLTLGLINLAQLTRIDAIAVSGSIALENNFLLEMLQKRLDERLHGSHLSLLPATLGRHAPLVGAVALFTISEETILH